MTLRIAVFINLVAYSCLVSQAFFYLLALGNVQRQLAPGPFIALRKLLDKNLQVTFRRLIYCCLLSNSVLVLLCAVDGRSALLISALISLFAIVADAVLALRGNIPINTRINGWSPESYTADWQMDRDKWLAIFARRQGVTIAGFLILVAGAVFGYL